MSLFERLMLKGIVGHSPIYLVDGLGGEELVPSGAGLTDKSGYFTGSVTTENAFSGAQVFSAGSVTGARVTDADGRIPSALIGSTATYGVRVQAGSVTTGAGSDGDILFGVAFNNNDYSITFGTSGNTNSTVLPSVSGTGMHSSGCGIIGDASTTYYYIAAGVA